MNKLILTISLLLAATSAVAQTGKHSAADVKKDIDRHLVISAAHDAAAKCLQSGKAHEACHKELAASCKGIAIGKYCGMKHEH